MGRSVVVRNLARCSRVAILKGIEGSKSPVELIEQQKGTPGRTASVDYYHILDGNLNKCGEGAGGHYLRSDNVRVVEVTKGPDRNG